MTYLSQDKESCVKKKCAQKLLQTPGLAFTVLPTQPRGCMFISVYTQTFTTVSFILNTLIIYSISVYKNENVLKNSLLNRTYLKESLQILQYIKLLIKLYYNFHLYKTSLLN